jgi:ribosomal protein S18 acetylase RimI-like enzyme
MFCPFVDAAGVRFVQPIEMLIERASVTDVKAIQAVLRATWLDTYSPYLAQATLDEVTAVWHDAALLEARIRDRETFFAVAKENDGGIAGLVTAQRRPDGDLFIYRLYVRPDLQNKGLGTALYQATLAAFPGTSKVRLQVLTNNQKGFAFWRKLGFSESGGHQETVAGETIPVMEMEARLP